MTFDLPAALVAGTGAAVAMAVPVLVAGANGRALRLDMPAVWGGLLRVGDRARAVGVLIHMIVSAAVGVLYAVAFDAVDATDGTLWAWGLLGGLVHWLIAGVVIGSLVAAASPAGSPTAGTFCRRFGPADVAVFTIAHAAYGLTVGLLYAALT